MKNTMALLIFVGINLQTVTLVSAAGPAIGGGANTVQASRGYLRMENSCKKIEDSEQTLIAIDEFIKPVHILPGYQTHLAPQLEKLKEADPDLHSLLLQKINELVFYWNVPVEAPSRTENIHGYRFQNSQTKWQYPGRRVFVYSGQIPCLQGSVDAETMSTLIVHEAFMRAKLILGNGVIHTDDTTDVTELTAALMSFDREKFEKAKVLLSARVVTGIDHAMNTVVSDCAAQKQVNIFLDYLYATCKEGQPDYICFERLQQVAKNRMPQAKLNCFNEITHHIDKYCKESNPDYICYEKREKILKHKLIKD